MSRWWLPIAGAAVVLACAAAARGLTFSADPTAHFPRGNPAVAAWLELSLRFDAFNTLIVGLEEPAAPLTADGLRRVQRLTGRLSALKANGVLAAASVTNVESLAEGSDGSLEAQLLVSAIPDDTAALAKRIAANPQVSGALISRDQRGYVIILRADPRRDPAELARAIRAAVEEERGPLIATYFGAPFFQAAIARTLAAKAGWLVPAMVLLLVAVLGVFARRAAWALGASVLVLIVWLGALRVFAVTVSPATLTAGLALLILASLVFARAARPAWRALAAIFLGSLALLMLEQLAAFALALALGSLAIAVVLVLIVRPLTSAAAPPSSPRAGFPVVWFAAVALVSLGFAARQLEFHGTPQAIFSKDDDAGRSLAFFDRRFGGPDFIQLDFRGDLRDPELAARLLRLTDLLEGAFPDVRAVAPILAFLNHGFGGVHRIPTSRESLNNLWFFLEGRPDVRNLVSENRDEAMVVLRVPTTLPRPIAELVSQVDAAVSGSAAEGRVSTRARLVAVARTYALDAAEIDALLEAPVPETRAAIEAALEKWLASGDSPYQPTREQWSQLATALRGPDDGRVAKLSAVTATFTELGDPSHAAQLVESVLAREKDLRLSLHALALTDRLWPTAPDAARIRAQGIFADHLDPHAGPGAAAAVTVTGLPVVAAHIEAESLSSLWRALGLLLGVGALVHLASTRKPAAALRALLEAALAAGITFAAGAAWLGADPGSLALYLLPPLAALAVQDSAGRAVPGILLALAASCGLLLFTGSLPLMRIGWVLTVGLGAVALLRLTSPGLRSDVVLRPADRPFEIPR